MRRHSKSCPAQNVSAPDFITPHPGILALPANIFADKGTLNVSNNMPGNPSFCCFASFVIF